MSSLAVQSLSDAELKEVLQPQPHKPVINKNAIAQESVFPAANGIRSTETTTLLFENRDILIQTVMQPKLINAEVVIKVAFKLEPILGKPIYPSQLVKLIVELAFSDPEPVRLTPDERTNNLGYILSNLGNGDPSLIKELFAYYYGYSFERFAK